MNTVDKKKQAQQYFDQAEQHHMRGELEHAVELYIKSIELCPTAKAYTWLGWAYSMMGRLQEAIEECQNAIQTDPDFGNPYNDIGAYLIELGEDSAAISWLEKALCASNYDSRAFPHMNLARIWESQLRWEKAIMSYKEALRENPEYKQALVALKKLQALLN